MKPKHTLLNDDLFALTDTNPEREYGSHMENRVVPSQ